MSENIINELEIEQKEQTEQKEQKIELSKKLLRKQTQNTAFLKRAIRFC